MRTVLVTLIGPERTADLVVDADTPVAELMPSLLISGGVAEAADPQSWRLALMGREPLDLAHTLEHAEVLDGAVLVLRRDAVAPERPPTVMAATAPGGSPLERARRRLADGGSLARAVTNASPVRCATIALASPKGGVGKTTLSILLGELLATLRDDVVLALDADSDYGSLGRVGHGLATTPGEAGRDDGIFQSLNEGAATFAELDRKLWKLPGGLRIVPSPREPAAMAQTDRATYARVIGHLQRLAEVLIIDCGTGLGQPGVQAAILACDQLIVVTDASATTAALVHEATALLERAGRPITVVCNRLRRGRAGTEDLARIDKLFPRASALVGVPEDAAALLALRGESTSGKASRALHDAVLELAAVLTLSWPEVGLESVSA